MFCCLAKPPHPTRISLEGQWPPGWRNLQIIKEQDRDENDPGEASVAPPGLQVSRMDGHPSGARLRPAQIFSCTVYVRGGHCETVVLNQPFFSLAFYLPLKRFYCREPGIITPDLLWLEDMHSFPRKLNWSACPGV